MKRNALELTDKEIEKYVVPFNRMYRKKNPFSWYSIKYRINEFIIKILEKLT